MRRRVSVLGSLAACVLLAACRARVPPAPPAVDRAAQAIAAAVASLERGETVGVDGDAIASTVALPALYRRRQFRLAWSDRGAVDDLVRAVEESADDGLEPRDYHRAAIERLRTSAGSRPEARAELDLLLTDAAIVLAHDLRFGKAGSVALDAEPASAGSESRDDDATLLQRALDEGRVHAALGALRPRSPLYARLAAALAEHRRIEAGGGWVDVPAGAPLKRGMMDARVVLLRQRLGASGDLPGAAAADPSPRYDEAVEAGVRAFQERHGLPAAGAVDAATLQALDVPVAIRIAQIRATMERCRWVMHDLPDRFVLVNVAAFTVAVVDGGGPVWESRVIVGDRYTQTPTFRADMRSVVLNPKWMVPPGIMRNEIEPAMRRDPGYLRRKGYVMVNGQVVQPPGPTNPLGRIKLLLPNRHHVYLHDTPSKRSFAKATRTFSHGCVRVEHPFELAALALDDSAWTAAALADAAATGKPRTIVLRRPVPVVILYATAMADPDGRVRFLPDVYEHDADVVRALAEPGARRSGR